MKNIAICKKCWKERKKVSATVKITGSIHSIDIGDMMENIESPYWQFQYCNLETPFDEQADPPEQCPYILEHTVTKK